MNCLRTVSQKSMRSAQNKKKKKKYFSLSAREVNVKNLTTSSLLTDLTREGVKRTLGSRWQNCADPVIAFHFTDSGRVARLQRSDTRKWCFHISLNKCVMSDLFSEANVMYVQKTWNAFRPFMSSHHLHIWPFGQFWFKIGFSALIEALPVWNKLVFFSGNVSFIHEIIPQVKLGSCREGGQVEVRFPASSTIFQRSLLRGWTKALAKRHVSGG